MAKIYEALENAQKGMKGFEKPEIPSSPPIPLSPYSAILPSLPTLYMEEEMIQLHHSIGSILPEPKKKIIQFIGSIEGEGTSTIVREFALVSAGKFGESVLLMDADHHKPVQHLFFKLKPDHGWEEAVKDNAPIDKVLYQINVNGNAIMYQKRE